MLKRAFDIAGAGFGLFLLAPLLLTLAIIIRSGSKGPIFFRQTRTGRNNKPFQIFKFRSMYTDRCDITGVAQTIKDDPRVTPIGRVMRRTNLDELPQLINVLRGEMSLVGPRPHVPGMLAAGELYEDLVPEYERRHLMRPGITGLAQVNGLRGPTTERKPSVERVMCDLTYVRDFSPLARSQDPGEDAALGIARRYRLLTGGDAAPTHPRPFKAAPGGRPFCFPAHPYRSQRA